jgi:hypothetical protein
MGIDIYSRWKNQDENDKSQVTGFSVIAGNVGYLREAYHGGPYVTKYLVAEAFKDDAKIPASILRERLPIAVLMAMYREKKVYSKEDPTVATFDDIQDKLKDVFSVQMKDESHEEFVKTITPHHIEYAKKLIADKVLPDYAQSFVDFVDLLEFKEKENGEPCTVIASY